MKYVGSKRRLKKYLIPIINQTIKNNNITTYIEPFVGGANLIGDVICEKRIGNDINHYVISLFQELQKGWIPPDTVTEEMYAKAKNGEYSDHLTAFIAIPCSFGAKWFGGYARGETRNYADESKRSLLKQLNKIKDVAFISKDYRKLKIPKNALVYCDPPYANSLSYKDDFKSDIFWQWVRKLPNIVLISELEAPDDFVAVWSKKLVVETSRNTKPKNTEKLFIHKSKVCKVSRIPIF